MSSTCGEVKPDASKIAGDSHPIDVDLFDYCALRWRANSDVVDGENCRPRTPFGFALEALNDGTTGGSEPPWSGPLGREIKDGSVTWKVVAAGLAGISPASAPDAEVSPVEDDGLEVDDLAIVEGRRLIGVYTGGVPGHTYTVLLSFEVNGYPRQIRHTVAVS
jgi:hypothetical protein